MVFAQAVPIGQEETVDTATALLHLAFIIGMVGLLVGGIVIITVLWYVRGRDPATGLIAEYIPEPPDDLPPGAAGTLLDERADHEDVVATLLGLARHGAIQIHELPPDEDIGRRRTEYEIEVFDPAAAESRLESDLLAALFNGNPAPGSRAMLRDIKPLFDAREPRIKYDLYQELVDRGYFVRSPEVTRDRWRRIAWAGLILTPIVGFVVFRITDGFAFLPTVAAMVVWFMLLRMSKSMPQKTLHGAESAARWRAFRTYLQSISKYENLEESKILFDKYLSYAVAFGLQKQWISSFAAVGVSTPAWFDSPAFGGGMGWDAFDTAFDMARAGHMIGHLGGGNVDVGDVNMPNVGLPNVGMPDVDMQGMAEGLGGGLEAASSGLGGLLDIAGGIFDSIDFDF
jgi:hypothetical protein